MKKICTIGIVLCIVVGICSYNVLSNYFTKNESINITTDEKELNRAFEQLNSSINAGMSLDQIINEFEAMCQIPARDSMILYEAGRYAFHLEPLFHIILVRQYHDVDGNKNQIYVDIQYEPDIKNTDFRECVWGDETQEDIFDYIKSSKAYQYASQTHYSKVNAYIK